MTSSMTMTATMIDGGTYSHDGHRHRRHSWRPRHFVVDTHSPLCLACWMVLLLSILLLSTSHHNHQHVHDRQSAPISTINRLGLVSALATPSSIKRRSGRTRRRSPSSGNGFEKPKHDGTDEEDRRLPEETTSSPSNDPVPLSTETTTPTMGYTTPTSSGADKIYSLPALYDMAFGYRNYDEEVEFLFDQHSILQQQARQPQKGEETDSSFFPRRVLELAAGPARHSLEAVVRLSESEPPSDGDDGGVSSTRVTAVDISKPMKQYGLELASTELDVDSQKLFDYRLGDMTNFDLFDQTDMISDKNQDTTATPFDTAWLLLGSLQHLTRNDDVVRCFQCVNKHLRPGGTFILELPHPRELFSLVECTRNGWEVPLEGEDGEVIGELKIVWGDDHDDFDPITQVRQFTVAMELTGASEEQQTNQQDEGGRNPSTLTTKVKKSREQSEIVVLQSVKEVVPMRHFTAQEIDCFAKLSGFELKSKFGALDAKVKIDDDDEAFRLVCILQKPYHTF